MAKKTIVITGISLDKLISVYFKDIVKVVEMKSKRMNINIEDLQSSVNYTLSLALKNDSFTGNTEYQFFAWIHTMVFNAGINIIRARKRETPYLLDLESLEIDIDSVSISKSYQACNSYKNFINSVRECIKQKYGLKGNKFYIDVFNRVLIDGEQYHEVSESLGIPINNVKTAVFQIRKTLSQKLGNQYLQLINN